MSRAVTRARGGSSGIDSVNERRAHAGSRQRQRRLCHTRRTPASAYGMSRGREQAEPFTDVDSTPQLGHADAVSSAVTTCTTRAPDSSRSTRTTASPSMPSNRVAPASMPS